MVMTAKTVRSLIESEQQREGLRAQQQRQTEADHEWLRSREHNSNNSNDNDVMSDNDFVLHSFIHVRLLYKYDRLQSRIIQKKVGLRKIRENDIIQQMRND